MKSIDEKIARQVVRPRPAESHKGTFGRVLLIGGNKQYGGAIIMAAEAAVSAGAGLTTVATDPVNFTALHARLPEAAAIDYSADSLKDQLASANVILCGPGLGTDELAWRILDLVCRSAEPDQAVVFDASALDLLSQRPDLLKEMRAGELVLTPHQMEWQRLSGIKIADQGDRANQEALERLFSAGMKNVILVLKAHRTRVYDLTGEIYRNSAGNPGMATGGMGDTLAGITAAFIGQFGQRLSSVLAAVYCHSKAGDDLYESSYLVRPTQLSAYMPRLMKRLSTC
ncbi:NAD(P)H-hydrate dehydratase [Lactobacillus nasalidis]|nr:NAD(P)H-hydrate dehydratase [Lactobacillus nasalidis]